jgi:hypothetical protein
MVKNKLEGKDKLTPWEQFLEKKKEKKRLKKKQKVSVIVMTKYLLNTNYVSEGACHPLYQTVTTPWSRPYYHPNFKRGKMRVQ